MRRIAALGFALIGATVLIAVSAAAASAETPAFTECKKLTKNAEGKYTGEFTNKTCSETSVAKEGKYELAIGTGKKVPSIIKGKSGKAELETPGAGTIECTSSKSVGTLEAPNKISKIAVEYKGCKSAGKKCNSAGSPGGTIKTHELAGELGYISKAAHEVGTLITAVGGGHLADFECEGLKVEVEGGVIGVATPVNTFSKEGKLLFFKNGSKKQEHTNFEGEPAGSHVLMTEFSSVGVFLESSQEQENTQKGQFLEIKA